MFETMPKSKPQTQPENSSTKKNNTTNNATLTPVKSLFTPLVTHLKPIIGNYESTTIPKTIEAQKRLVSKPNNTGIPTPMKNRFEALSGFSFDDVKVHYNSGKPSQLRALAYTKGNQVFVAPGQEKHLGHELGHVVQQKQGIVKPTKKINGLNLNDDVSLEYSANNCFTMKKSIVNENHRRTTDNPIQLLSIPTIDEFRPINSLPNDRIINQPLMLRPTLTGASQGGSIYTNCRSSYSDPVLINGMDKWIAYTRSDGRTDDLLNDPTRKGYRLTLMHVISGWLHGQSSNDNMVLGTKFDNETHSRLVEQIVIDFVTLGAGAGAVLYCAYPKYSGRLPQFINEYINHYDSYNYWVNKKDRTEYINWVKNSLPKGLGCTVCFYLLHNNTILENAQADHFDINCY